VRAAALAILATDGPEGFTVRAVAQAANVAPMAIYNHFEGKNGLIDNIFAEGFTELSVALRHDLGSPIANLIEAGRAYRRFALAHRGHYLVMFLHRFDGFEPSVTSAELAGRAYMELVAIIEKCVEAGDFPPRDPYQTAQTVWAMVHGYVALEMNQQMFADDAEETYEHALRVLIAGLRE
jgi:AcrR family transcriptional regulator